MTTARTPVAILMHQAVKIARHLKQPGFRSQAKHPEDDHGTFAIAMDDGMRTIRITWAHIAETSESDFVKEILAIMQGPPDPSIKEKLN